MRDPLGTSSMIRNPDTVFLLTLLLVAGLGQLASGSESDSVSALVPHWVAIGWGVILTTGAGVTLAGVLWRSRLTGLMVEAAGRIMLGPACLAYAVAIVEAAAWNGALPAGLCLALAASSVWRLVQIRRGVIDLQHILRTMTHAAAEARR